MSIVLFAILGAGTHASAGYWICFAIYCLFYAWQAIKSAANDALW